MSIDFNQTSGEWYTFDGKDLDVVLSTRVRLARNLANFPFPHKLDSDEAERVISIIFDAFNQLPDREKFQCIGVKSLEDLPLRILVEHGFLDSPNKTPSGLIISSDSVISATVNQVDHLRLVHFLAGFSPEAALNKLSELDKKLQNYIQFAASYDFGYLNSKVLDSGSGLKLSVRLFLPCLTLQNKIPELINQSFNLHYNLSAPFGSRGTSLLNPYLTTGSLGCYYELSTTSCSSESEIQNLASFSSYVQSFIVKERQERAECSKLYSSIFNNYILRSLSVARFSLFISIREAVEIISGIELGLCINRLKGITFPDLHALLFKIQTSNLDFVLANGHFKFDTDIEKSIELKKDRLRALIIQETLEHVDLIEE